MKNAASPSRRDILRAEGRVGCGLYFLLDRRRMGRRYGGRVASEPRGPPRGRSRRTEDHPTPLPGTRRLVRSSGFGFPRGGLLRFRHASIAPVSAHEDGMADHGRLAEDSVRHARPPGRSADGRLAVRTRGLRATDVRRSPSEGRGHNVAPDGLDLLSGSRGWFEANRLHVRGGRSPLLLVR